jgi:hypothetical protein
VDNWDSTVFVNEAGDWIGSYIYHLNAVHETGYFCSKKFRVGGGLKLKSSFANIDG